MHRHFLGKRPATTSIKKRRIRDHKESGGCILIATAAYLFLKWESAAQITVRRVAAHTSCTRQAVRWRCHAESGLCYGGART